MHMRVRVYLLIPDPESRKPVDLEGVVKEELCKIEHILDHPIYGERAREFVRRDVEREFLDPPELPDLPEGFSEALAEFHNDVVKTVYRFSSPARDKSFMVRVPVPKGIARELEKMVDEGIKPGIDFDSGIRVISKVVELGLVKGIDIWPQDLIEDYRARFIEAGLNPRELEEYYEYKRTSSS